VRAGAITAVLAATAILVALPATGAAAAPGRGSGHPHPTITEQLLMRSTNGYVIEATLRNRRSLTVLAVKLSGDAVISAEYTLQASQPPGSTEIKASLGRLGRIDVHFVSESKNEVEALLPLCAGEKDTVESGTFVGLFEFRGEHGYTRSRRRSMLGSVTIQPPRSCPAPAPNRPRERGTFPEIYRAARTRTGGVKAARVSAELKATPANPRVSFAAQDESGSNRHGKKVTLGTFIASASRNRGRIEETSSAIELFVKGHTFIFPDPTRPAKEAVLAPPEPFLGSGTFRRESPHQVSWSGDLRANLPGFGVVPLAGPGATATMCADAGCPLGR
jgi:hypothetical protein